ncbi:MAG: hypothetical protein FGM37_02875 [Phycisphaerales bacterium]|nr:hypothetical protein [Phycisphaerales bacterium]
MISPDVHFDLVHVGKCGGSTIATALRASGFRFEHVHMRRPAVSPSRSYVVLVRDPMQRFVSAFNWRRHRLRGDLNPDRDDADPLWRLKHQSERAFLSMFESAGALAERLVAEPGFDVSPAITLMDLIGHVPHGFHWYLGHLLEEIKPSQLRAVVCQERLEEDIQAAFGLRVSESRNWDYPRVSGELSPLARQNLARVLADEYRTLERLGRVAAAAGIPMSMRYVP